MKIKNINIGLCHRRVQEGKPAHAVNWTQDGVNKCRFFAIVSACYTFKVNLINVQSGVISPETAKTILGL
jgi:hypothetical protein